jgi:hypothetical protein
MPMNQRIASGRAPGLDRAGPVRLRLSAPFRHPGDELASPGVARKQDELAVAYAKDGYALVEAV